jgi:hypothetical protein
MDVSSRSLLTTGLCVLLFLIGAAVFTYLPESGSSRWQAQGAVSKGRLAVDDCLDGAADAAGRRSFSKQQLQLDFDVSTTAFSRETSCSFADASRFFVCHKRYPRMGALSAGSSAKWQAFGNCGAKPGITPGACLFQKQQHDKQTWRQQPQQQDQTQYIVVLGDSQGLRYKDAIVRGLQAAGASCNMQKRETGADYYGDPAGIIYGQQDCSGCASTLTRCVHPDTQVMLASLCGTLQATTHASSAAAARCFAWPCLKAGSLSSATSVFDMCISSLDLVGNGLSGMYSCSTLKQPALVAPPPLLQPYHSILKTHTHTHLQTPCETWHIPNISKLHA